MITWDKNKDQWLRKFRKVSFEDIAGIIEAGKYLAAIINPAYEGQLIFIVNYNDYTYAVPYEIDRQDNIVLKTAYPSRKYHKMYGLNS